MSYRINNAVDTSQENIEEESVEMHASTPPSPVIIQPRKLRFESPCPNRNPMRVCSNNLDVSPPYRKVRALRLFDTPATPKTILKKSTNHLSAAAAADVSKRQELQHRLSKTAERPRILPLHNRALDNIVTQNTANVNPFTPESLKAQNKKRCRPQNENLNNRSLQLFLDREIEENEEDLEEKLLEVQAPKRLALQDTNISRYQKEFVELSLVGVGEFGLVYQCLNRLDGCIYAIKKSIKPVAGSFFEKRALNEVWAHAVLGKHDNVVRYYSAWAEDNHMLIQNEFCNVGSLQSFLQKRALAESELKVLLLHVAEGLRYIHSNDLVHMDLKPGNIFLTKVPSVHKSTLPPLTKECYEHGMDTVYEELQKSECIITYKIGDLGHVTSIKEPQVEEGDCHYLPKEILQENYTHLKQADIFSLGLTLFEAAGGGPLPRNGPDWHTIRNGQLPNIPTLSKEFNDLINLMIHSDPLQRPSSTTIFNHPILSSMESKTKQELSQELAIEKHKNEILLSKLREAKKMLKIYEQAAKVAKTVNVFSNQRCLRSCTRNKRPYIISKMDRN